VNHKLKIDNIYHKSSDVNSILTDS